MEERVLWKLLGVEQYKKYGAPVLHAESALDQSNEL